MNNRIVRSEFLNFNETENYNDLVTTHRNTNNVRTFFWHRNDEISRELELNITNARARENKR